VSLTETETVRQAIARGLEEDAAAQGRGLENSSDPDGSWRPDASPPSAEEVRTPVVVS
jgi:hypothetical protein